MAQPRPLVYVCSDESDLSREFIQSLRAAGVRFYEPKPAPLGANRSDWQRVQIKEHIQAADVIIMLSSSVGLGWPLEELNLIGGRFKGDGIKVIPVFLGHTARQFLPDWCRDLEGPVLNKKPPYGPRFDRLLAVLHTPGFDPVVQPGVGSSFYLHSIEISSHRCFKRAQRLQFSSNGALFSRWTVILGDNGVGKTTILRAIAHFGHVSPPEELPKESELILELAGDPPHRVSSAQIEQVQDRPTIYAYGAGRGVHTARLTPTSVHPAATLFDDGAALPDAEEWWLQTDYAARVSNDESARTRLQRVNQALVNLLPDVTGISVQLDEQKQPRLMAETIHGRVLLRDLSLGYNTALTSELL